MINPRREAFKNFIDFNSIAQCRTDKHDLKQFKRKHPPLRTKLLRSIPKCEEKTLVPIEADSNRLPFVSQVHWYFPRRNILKEEAPLFKTKAETPQLGVPPLYKKVLLGMLSSSPHSRDQSPSRTQDILNKSKGSSFEAFLKLSKTPI